MNGISLFTGGAIGELVFKTIMPNYRTIGYVEIDRRCQELIQRRIKDGVLDDAPIFDDIREFNRRYASLYAGKVDWLSGGFPCQPFSIAGNKLGEADERNLWAETRDAITILRPRYFLLENVPNIVTFPIFPTILADITTMRYDCEWDIVSAAFVGAPHLRRRFWLVANDSTGARKHKWPVETLERQEQVTDTGRVCALSDDNKSWKLQSQGSIKNKRRRTGNSGWWETEPDVGRVVDGVANRLHRLAMLGNGWCPQTVVRILNIQTRGASMNEKEEG